MDKQQIRSIFLLVLLSLVAACNSSASKQEIGTVSGAVLGGIIGTALTASSAGTIGGAAAGAYFGSSIGKELD